MQAARGHANERGHCAVDTVAEAEALGIEIVKTLANECGIIRENSGRFADDAVAFFEAAHATSLLGNNASEFVAEDNGKIHMPALRASVLM